MRQRLLTSIVTIATLSISTPVMAEYLDNCHKLAGMHVEWNDMKPAQAIEACRIAVAIDPEDGYMAFLHGRALNRNKDYAEALAAYQRAEELDEPDAITLIGYMYLFGEGVPKDYAKAWDRFRTATYLHSSLASVAIAYVYEHGLGVEKDPHRAGTLYTLAAKGGQRQAMINVGAMLWNGKVVPKDINMALQVYQMAADAGSGTAQLFLAHVYRDGSGVPADPHKAAYYYEKAIVTGSKAVADEISGDWDKWPVEVAQALQLRLKKSAQFEGDINGKLTQGTAAAINRIYGTAPIPPRKTKPKELVKPTDLGDWRKQMFSTD